MNSYAVLTAVGGDKPGLVASVSKFILECGCNIEDSRMAILGGEFAMLILITGSGSSVEKLLDGASKASAESGLVVQIKRTRAPGEAAHAQEGTVPYSLEAYSMDHPGIVQGVAHFLTEHAINIRAMDTRLTYAPVTGLPLFSLHATVDVPAQKNVAEIRRGLEQIAARQNIDILMKAAGR